MLRNVTFRIRTPSDNCDKADFDRILFVFRRNSADERAPLISMSSHMSYVFADT